DPNQLAVRGWSYGGILGGWTITQTPRFKAASLGAMVADWASEYAMGFNHDVRRWYIGGTPWENPEGYRKHSAYTYIDKVTTPTLILHGAQDERVPVGQAQEMYRALKDRGRTTELVFYPRAGHGITEYYHQKDRLRRIRDWITKYAVEPATTSAPQP
ncbi:MAG: alpha/beta hydrolase family protein, partial [Vicinamibacteria bacterium]